MPLSINFRVFWRFESLIIILINSNRILGSPTSSPGMGGHSGGGLTPAVDCWVIKGSVPIVEGGHSAKSMIPVNNNRPDAIGAVVVPSAGDRAICLQIILWV